MFKLSAIIGIFVIISSANGNFYGPFLLWGQAELENIKLSALSPINEKTLSNIYGQSKAVILFLRNGTSRLDKENFPSFQELVTNSHWAYLPQQSLPVDAIDFNYNVEIINLVGSASQQDVEISALYRDAVNMYGQGKVLGILANQIDEHNIFKREAAERNDGSFSSTTASITEEPPIRKNSPPYSVYIANDTTGKAILYTEGAPILKIIPETSDEKTITKELINQDLVKRDGRDQQVRLVISFKTDEGKSVLRFRFPLTPSKYWSLAAVEVEDANFNGILPVDGELPSAPIGFSHKCTRSLIFRNGSVSLELKNVQVQPVFLGPYTRFDDAYDCVGFTTAPIWSGIFISAILIFGLFVGIIALMEIKAPNKFENNRSKQLTFTVQD